jgi:hypothetical protein
MSEDAGINWQSDALISRLDLILQWLRSIFNISVLKKLKIWQTCHDFFEIAGVPVWLMNYNIFETHSLSGYLSLYFFSFHFIIRADCPYIIVFDQVMDVLFRDRNNEEKKDEHKRLGTTTSFINAK